MRLMLPTIALTACAVSCAPSPKDPAPNTQNPEPNFISLFNGEDLTGWKGDPAFWSVSEGAITGQTTPENPTSSNTFLIWDEGTPANFELRLSFKLTGQNEKGFANSGIQYRSRIIDPERYSVGGYQADLDLAGKYLGMLYEERGRGLIMTPGQRIHISTAPTGSEKPFKVEVTGTATQPEEILAAYKRGEWNEFRIVAEGNRLRHYLNGTLTAEIVDDDPAHARASGAIALQLHTGPPMTVQFKDVRLKQLPQ